MRKRKPKPLMTTKDVMTALGVSRARVVQLEARLQPVRTASGIRLYDSVVVNRVIRERRARARREARR